MLLFAVAVLLSWAIQTSIAEEALTPPSPPRFQNAPWCPFTRRQTTHAHAVAEQRPVQAPGKPADGGSRHCRWRDRRPPGACTGRWQVAIRPGRVSGCAVVRRPPVTVQIGDDGAADGAHRHIGVN